MSIEIPLSTFIDYAIKSGSPKLTVAKNAKKDLVKEYDPAEDYYRGIRKQIIDFHKAGKKLADEFAPVCTDIKKKANYADVASGYKKFLKTQKKFPFTFHGEPKCTWACNGLAVWVNPELDLTLDGRTAVKLYFKQDPIDKFRVQAILSMLNEVFKNGQAGIKPAILDVRRGRFYTGGVTDPELLKLMEAEAASFVSLVNSL